MTIRNLTAAVAAPGILISGVPGHKVENVLIENAKIRLPGGGRAEVAKIELPEAADAYPEIRMFGPVIPAYGAYIRHRHAAGVRLLNRPMFGSPNLSPTNSSFGKITAQGNGPRAIQMALRLNW